jgi:hypothetical protein
MLHLSYQLNDNTSLLLSSVKTRDVELNWVEQA